MKTFHSKQSILDAIAYWNAKINESYDSNELTNKNDDDIEFMLSQIDSLLEEVISKMNQSNNDVYVNNSEKFAYLKDEFDDILNELTSTTKQINNESDALI